MDDSGVTVLTTPEVRELSLAHICLVPPLVFLSVFATSSTARDSEDRLEYMTEEMN